MPRLVTYTHLFNFTSQVFSWKPQYIWHYIILETMIHYYTYAELLTLCCAIMQISVIYDWYFQILIILLIFDEF